MVRSNMINVSPAMKLHLGCGERYLDGYSNIDYPESEHTVQAKIKADKYEDIRKLVYSSNSIDEIRLHHVFEHFPRTIALALLCRWRDWLKPGGLLRIETPDAMASFKAMISPFISFDSKQQVMRNLFGSHEATWAVHWDGWYKEKLEITLTELGFCDLRFVKNKWGMCRNIEVFACKPKNDSDIRDYASSVEKLLKMSTIRVNTKEKDVLEGSELEMLKVWMNIWKETYEKQD